MAIINDFKKYESNNVLRKTFMDGYCYEFALMICRNVENSRIFFIVEEKHYVIENNGRYYDIRGEIHVNKNHTLQEDTIERGVK